MDICRICLSSQADKNISQLQINKEEDTENYIEIILFCLDIQLEEDSKISRKLCSECYKKIITFYKFKLLAIRNDAFLKSIDTEACVKIDTYICGGYTYIVEDKTKEEPVNKENSFEDIHNDQSDDEVLRVIKIIKNEDIREEIKEKVLTNNHPIAPVKKRGRAKQLKSKTNSKALEFCDQCGKAVWNLKEHSYMHKPLEDRKRIECKECDKMFLSYGALYKHFKITHLGIRKHCNICNKDVINLKHHHLLNHNSKDLPFECVLCGRRFLVPSTLKAHMTTHTKDKPFECDICQKKYRKKVHMVQHKRLVHDKERSHLCEYCPQRYFKKYHLQVHLRKHTKEKPFTCPQCDKSFASSTRLKNHQLIHSDANREHTKEKPFTCPQCDKSFPSSTRLKNHQLSHSDVKGFECTLCDSAFARPEYLRSHMLCHTKEKKHPCKYCGVKFGRSDHRKRHEWTAHEKHLITAESGQSQIDATYT